MVGRPIGPFLGQLNAFHGGYGLGKNGLEFRRIRYAKDNALKRPALGF